MLAPNNGTAGLAIAQGGNKSNGANVVLDEMALYDRACARQGGTH